MIYNRTIMCGFYDLCWVGLLYEQQIKLFHAIFVSDIYHYFQICHISTSDCKFIIPWMLVFHLNEFWMWLHKSTAVRFSLLLATVQRSGTNERTNWHIHRRSMVETSYHRHCVEAGTNVKCRSRTVRRKSNKAKKNIRSFQRLESQFRTYKFASVDQRLLPAQRHTH